MQPATPPSPVLKFVVAGLALAATALVAALVASGWSLSNLPVVAALGIAAIVAERSRLRLGQTLHISTTWIPVLVAAVLFGPLAAMVVAFAAWLDHFRAPYSKWLTYTSTNTLIAAAAGVVAAHTHHLVSGGPAPFFVATLAATAVTEILDLGSTACITRLRGMSALQFVRTVAPVQLTAAIFYAPVVAILAYAYKDVSGWTLVLFFGPALAAQRLYALYQRERQLAQDLSAANVRLERANLSFATALVATLDARDRYTAGHSAAVAIYARDIAERLGLSEDEQQLAHQCGLVHDIGKIGLPPGLLEKPGALTLSERRQMETHSEIGEHILKKVEDYAEIAQIVRHHHERWDGQGYPDGIASLDIPLISRIISVADAYNAMTSDRPYRDAMPSRVARMRLAQGVESQFDTTIVAAFEAILAGADEEYRTGKRADFSLADQDVYSPPVAAVEPESAAELAPVKPKIAEVA
ncbi:MAG TPA: HD-GYP domain-containing protein [Gaiellaceae bacterium]|nr:HD-GYP domain-containing protein [Gaiellaceae bacterium]